MRYDLRYVFLSKLLFGFKTKIGSHDHYGDIVIDSTVPKFSKFILRKVTYVAVSLDLIEWAVNKVGLPRKEIFLLSNIVQINKMNVIRNDVKQGAILMVANIRPAKNIEFALEIMRAFKQADRDYTLDIVGQINDKEYYLTILKLIDQYQLTKNVKLIHDCYNVQAIIPRYSLAIHTAKSESGPLVLIEYLGNSIPFVAFRTGQVVEQIQNDLPEFINSFFELDTWTSSIIKLVDENREGASEDLRTKMKTVFEKYFSEEKYFQGGVNIYDFAINRASGC